ncbi:MAG: ABC transporter permease [Deltaproteobacteria bacterium]|nr:ABC transporter permease [Deltaproteobacteria bacterium]
MELNPIIGKELRVILRRRRAFGLQLAYLSVLVLLVFAVWPRGGVYSLGALASRDLFTVLSLGQLILVALFSPAFTSTSITLEKERGTFDLLFASLLKPGSIITGKLISSVAVLLILIFSSLPIMSVSFLLGGVSLAELGRAVLVLVSATLLFGMLGLALSAVSGRSYTATIMTYLLILILCVGVWVPSWTLAHWRGGATVFYILRSFSPFTAMLSVTQPDLLRAYGQDITGAVKPLTIFIRFSAVAIPVLIVLFIILIKKNPAIKPHRREALIRNRALLSERKRRFPYYLLDPLKERSMISRFDNPVSVKELRNSTMGKARWMLRGMYLCFIFSMVLIGLASGSMGVWSPDAIKIVAISFQLGLIILIGPSLTAGAITQEKEHGNYDMLRMTLLRPHTVIIGKLMVPLRHMVLLIVSTFPMFGMLWYLDFYSVTRVGVCLGIILTALVFTLASGIFTSSFCRTTASATAWAYGIVSFLSIFTFLSIVIKEKLAPALFHWIVAWNPFIAAMTAVTDEVFPDISVWRQNIVCLLALSLLMLVLTVIRFTSFGFQEK